MAELLAEFGFVKEAQEAYEVFIARDPHRPERLLMLARFLARQNRPAEAMETLTKAWSTGVPEQVAFAALSVCDAPSVQPAQKRQVEAWVVEALRRRPNALPLATKLGVFWVRDGRFDDAEKLLRRLIAGDPENAEALNTLAWLLAIQDQRKATEALALIERAIEIAGPVAALLDTRAVVRIRAGQAAKAIDDLEGIRASNPAHAASAVHLGWAYQLSGQPVDARKAFREADQLGWKLANADPLERSLMDKVRQDLSRAAH